VFTMLMFVLLLSAVVVFHELGHFMVGRFFKFGIEAFAVGFGRPLLKIKRGDIEYRLNWIPFGGYVKFIGESVEEEISEEDLEVSFMNQPAWQRMLVVFAGPAMNVILAFVIFSFMFLVGFPTSVSRIAYVEEGGPAAMAGLQPGDTVTEIDGKPVWRWEDLSSMVADRPNREVAMTVERDGEPVNLTVVPEMGQVRSIFGFFEEKGRIGIGQSGMRPVIGIPRPNTIAAQAGLKTGDLVLKIDGKDASFEADLVRALNKGGPHTLEVVSNFEDPQEQWERRTIELPMVEGVGLEAYGIEKGGLYIHQVVEESPAGIGGIQKHDRIAALDGQPLESWEAFTEVVRASADKPLALTVLRNGDPVELTVTPELLQEKDLMGEDLEYGRVGVTRLAVIAPPLMKPEKYLNPFIILKRGTELSVYWTVVTVKAFVFIFTGDVSPKAIGGPITIAVMAGESAKMGAFPFFLLMAIISLNLAVVNLLPIPILDGGHVVMCGIEMVRKKPLPERAMEYAGRAGFALLGLVVVLVLYNDLSRFSLNIKEFFVGLVNF
jgi:regulator of sigma E protease